MWNNVRLNPSWPSHGAVDNGGLPEASWLMSRIAPRRGAHYCTLLTPHFLASKCVFDHAQVQMNQLVTIRLIGQLTRAGGMLTSYASRMVTTSPLPFMNGITFTVSVSVCVVSGPLVCVADLLAYSTVKPILTSILRYATELNTHATS